MDYYGQDTPLSVYNELRRLEVEIEQCSANIRSLSQDAVNKQADYELLKNKELIAMFKEEQKDVPKRTEAQRTSLYRTKYSEERLAWMLAENELKGERDVLRALLGNQISTEVRLRLIDQDKKAASRAV